MKLNKDKINILLINWIKWDIVLQKVLRGIQIKILFERIIEERSFKSLSETYKVSPVRLRFIFLAILSKIERSHGRSMASLLRTINNDLEAIEAGMKPKKEGFDLNTVFLN